MTVTLTLNDDTEAECVMLTISNAGERECIVLLPVKDANSEEGRIYLYRYNGAEDGTSSLDSTGDGDEYEIVAEVSDELLDVQEYGELVDEVEEEQSG